MDRAARILKYARYGNLGVVASNHLRTMRGAPLRLMKHPMPNPGHSSTRRINKLVEALPGEVRYLEIGLYNGTTFQNVRAPSRYGVDPDPLFEILSLPAGVHITVGTSDEFFAGLDSEVEFDVVYLDGLHTFRQTYRDLINACRRCRYGVILLDDVVPVDEVSAIPDFDNSLREYRRLGLTRPSQWQGDVFRTILCLQAYHPELQYRTIISDGAPQSLVWLRDPATDVRSVDDTRLDQLEAIGFADVFSDGVPESFNPRLESDAINEAVADCPNRSEFATS